MRFNVNNYIRVKLTDLGREQHRKNHRLWCELHKYDYEYKAPIEDEDGWSEWQMWDFMREFGPYVSNTSHILFETEIEIPDN